jgi:hypothetical protein
MIVEWLLGAVSWLWQHLIANVPFPAVPDWLTSTASATSSLSSHFAGLGAWLPFPLLSTIGAAWLLVLVASLGLKVVRIVASFMTVGGGSAG